jgi:hypothetical protein
METPQKGLSFFCAAGAISPSVTTDLGHVSQTIDVGLTTIDVLPGILRELTIEDMEFVRTIDWDHAHIALDGGYQGQYLYAGKAA